MLAGLDKFPALLNTIRLRSDWMLDSGAVSEVFSVESNTPITARHVFVIERTSGKERDAASSQSESHRTVFNQTTRLVFENTSRSTIQRMRTIHSGMHRGNVLP